jgi:hypothetical protein
MNLRNIFLLFFILYLVGVECKGAYARNARKRRRETQRVKECDESKRTGEPIITLTSAQSHWANPIIVIESYFPCENTRTYKPFTGNSSNSIDHIHYKGSYVDGRRHGYGSLKRDEPVKKNFNFEYVGEFSDNLFHGRGVLKFPNGDEYYGDFQDGVFVKGIHYHKGLLKYEGSFKQRWTPQPSKSIYEGYGIYFYKNGGKYAGNYVNGLCRHNCIFTDPKGKVKERDWNFFFQQ